MNRAVDVVEIFGSMATKGTAPTEGCSLFGTGFEDAFERLRARYLERGFSRGNSAEKFVVGGFGAGKTHFLRQLVEIAGAMNCVTSYVPLKKALDFTKTQTIYSQVADALVVPGQLGHGIERLIEGCIEQVKQQAPSPELADRILDGWISSIEMADIELPPYRGVLRRTFEAYRSGDRPTLDAAYRWLRGEVANREVAGRLAVSTVPANEQNQHGLRSLLSLCQLIKHAGFQGTVVGFDEAEQSLDVSRTKRARVYSLLQSMINAMNDLRGGAALILYAITPSIVEGMDEFPALEQRIRDPGPGMGFFDGNTSAARIDLRWRKDPHDELRRIGHRLVEVFYQYADKELAIGIEEAFENADRCAATVAANNAESTSRRVLVKHICSVLSYLYETDTLLDAETASSKYTSEDTDDEV